jgi:hypothetical protein
MAAAVQVFESMNKALKLSCTKGLPLRVVRSFKASSAAGACAGHTSACAAVMLVALLAGCGRVRPECSLHILHLDGVPMYGCRTFVLQEKRSAYAPTVDTPVRYDGIYRIVKCWRTKGNQVQRDNRQ